MLSELYTPLLLLGLVMIVFVLRRPGFYERLRIGWHRSQPMRRPALEMACLSRTHLTPNHSLFLVECGRKVLLVATHPSGCSILTSETIGDQTEETLACQQGQ
jgi:flagellar biogenesis protein FliO